jgi:hypothetical protein
MVALVIGCRRREGVSLVVCGLLLSMVVVVVAVVVVLCGGSSWFVVVRGGGSFWLVLARSGSLRFISFRFFSSVWVSAHIIMKKSSKGR